MIFRCSASLGILLLFAFSAASQGSGKTLTFNGSSQFVDIGDQVANGCRTIEMWFKPNVNITSTLNDPKSLMIRDYNNSSGLNTDEFGLYFAPSSWQAGLNTGKVVFLRRVGTTLIQIASDNDFWQAGHWYHVCATIDPVSGMKLYINGILQQESDPSTSPIGTQTGTVWDKVSIGRWGNLDIRYFNGEIDEVRLWETSRTQTQIRDKMCTSLIGNEAGLRAYWNFDAGSGMTLADNSTNSWNGTLQGMTNANWIYSGAPIGNSSNYFYAASLSGTSTSLVTAVGDQLTVDNINSTAKGVQIYHVNTLPNVTTGVSSPATGNYYGVFLTSTNGTYDAAYDYSAYGCGGCEEIYTRNDNADMNWVQIATTPISCEFNLVNQSVVGFDYRAEYIINSGSMTIPGNVLGNDTTICSGSNLVLDPQIPGATYSWQDNSTNPTFTVTQSGLYTVEITSSCGTFNDSIYVTFEFPPNVDLGNDTALCQSGSILLDPGLNNVTYLWQDNSTGSTYTATQSGIYSVEVSNGCGTSSDSIEILLETLPDIDLGNDTTICENATFTLTPSSASGNYLWQDGSTLSSYTVTQPGVYWVQVSNTCGTDVDSISILFTPLPDFDLGNDTSICNGESILLGVNLSQNVLWQDGSYAPGFLVQESGIYYGTLTVGNCSAYDTIEIQVISTPEFDLGNDTLICEGDNLLLKPGVSGSYSWNNGSSEPTLVVNSPGTYSVFIQNQCGSQSDTIQIGNIECFCTYYLPNSFTPDGSEFNENFGMLYDCDFTDFVFRIYDRWGELIFESLDPDVWWDGTYLGKPVQNGTYPYKIQFNDEEEITKVITGHVNVLY